MEIFKMFGKNGIEYAEYLDNLWNIDYYKIKTHSHTNPQSLHENKKQYVTVCYILLQIIITKN